LALGLFLIFGFIASLIRGDGFDSSFLSMLGNILGVAVWAPIFYLFFAYLMTDISVDNDGMSVQFLWKTYKIRWDEVVEIKPFRPFGLFTNNRLTVVIVKSKLTFVYRMYGVLYGGKNQPAILIYRNISDCDLLLKNISMQTKNNFAKPVSET
jgi:hypothetical protein